MDDNNVVPMKTDEKSTSSTSLEKENDLLRTNLNSLQRRNNDLEKINEGLLEISKHQREEHNKMAAKTQQHSGAITGLNNKRL